MRPTAVLESGPPAVGGPARRLAWRPSCNAAEVACGVSSSGIEAAALDVKAAFAAKAHAGLLGQSG